MSSIIDKYLKESSKQFPLYGYSGPHSGNWNLDGVNYFTGEDFRNVKRFKEYKDAGFNRIMLAYDTKYEGEPWETSKTKKALDDCASVGIKEVMFFDLRIVSLTWIDGGIVGENKKFADDKSLDRYVADCIKPYKDHPSFFGLVLGDEPPYRRFASYGDVFRSIKRIAPEIYLHCNLLPLTTLAFANKAFPEGGTLFDRYEKYLDSFITETGCDYIMYDQYPFCSVWTVRNYFFKGLQIAIDLCKRRNIKLCFVAQSCGVLANQSRYMYMPDEKQLCYQLNLLLGFGVKDLGYFTYWSKQDNNTKGEVFPDGEACMTRNGEKTPTYYQIQKLNDYVKTLTPLLLSFEYEKTFCKIIRVGTEMSYLDHIKSETLEDIADITSDFGAVIASKSINKNTGERLYFITNAMRFDDKKEESVERDVKIMLTEGYSETVYYYRGEWHTADAREINVKLNDGETSLMLIK